MFKAIFSSRTIYALLLIIISINTFFAIASSWWQYILAIAAVAYVAFCSIEYLFELFSKHIDGFGIKLPSQRNQLFASAIALILTIWAMSNIPRLKEFFYDTELGYLTGTGFNPMAAFLMFIFMQAITGFICTVILHLFSLRKLVDLNLETIKTVVVEAVREENQRHHGSGKEEGAMMN